MRVAAAVAGVLALAGGAAGGMAARGAGVESPRARTLAVRSTPAGATVTVDGVALPGVTPLISDLELDDGAHTVKVALAAGEPVARKLVLTATDRFVVVSESLQSAGRVVIETRPPQARVLVDNRDVGRSPVVVEGVATDRPHAVEARKAGHKNATATIPVERGPEHTMTLVLEPTRAPGRLVVVAPVQGEVTVDGAPWGPTSTSIADERECPPGRHRIEVVAPALGTSRAVTVDVPERGVARVFVSF